MQLFKIDMDGDKNKQSIIILYKLKSFEGRKVLWLQNLKHVAS